MSNGPSEAQTRKVALELLRRENMKRALRAEMFDRQLALYDDPAQFKAGHPGRRSGKSTGMPICAALLVLDAGFNEVVLIAAETQRKARELHWASLHELCLKFNLPLTPNGQKGTFETPWGAKILFWGLKCVLREKYWEWRIRSDWHITKRRKQLDKSFL